MEEDGINDQLFELLEAELVFTFTRSSGPGGQHSNKVSTRVELKFHVYDSAVLNPSQKERISLKLKNRISKDGFLILVAQEERSQIRNKRLVTERFYELLSSALKPDKKRIPTRPSASAKIKRLDEKRKSSERKQARKKPDENNIN